MLGQWWVRVHVALGVILGHFCHRAIWEQSGMSVLAHHFVSVICSAINIRKWFNKPLKNNIGVVIEYILKDRSMWKYKHILCVYFERLNLDQLQSLSDLQTLKISSKGNSSHHLCAQLIHPPDFAILRKTSRF